MLKEWIIHKHTERWGTITTCSYSKQLLDPGGKIEQTTLRLSRNTLRKLTGYLTGHCALQAHLHRMGIKDTDTCPKCGEEPETIKHHLTRCPTYYATRIICWGTNTIALRDIKNDNMIKTMIKFVHLNKRLDEDT